MKIKELEEKRLEGQKTFKDFYKYFKSYKYNISITILKQMYEMYVS